MDPVKWRRVKSELTHFFTAPFVELCARVHPSRFHYLSHKNANYCIIEIVVIYITLFRMLCMSFLCVWYWRPHPLGASASYLSRLVLSDGAHKTEIESFDTNRLANPYADVQFACIMLEQFLNKNTTWCSCSCVSASTCAFILLAPRLAKSVPRTRRVSPRVLL